MLQTLTRMESLEFWEDLLRVPRSFAGAKLDLHFSPQDALYTDVPLLRGRLCSGGPWRGSGRVGHGPVSSWR
jgi:hypothetical protein